MDMTARAVLARWAGDAGAARAYCLKVAREYPHLRAEYSELAEKMERTECAAVGA